MHVFGQISAYPPLILIYGCYFLMILECAVCTFYAVARKGEHVDNEKAITSKALFLIVSIVAAYFLLQYVVPHALYSTDFLWNEHVFRLILNGLGAAVVMVLIYYLRRSEDNFSQLIVILLLVQVIYLYIKSFEQITNSAFSYYMIFYFMGSNAAYVLLKLAEAK